MSISYRTDHRLSGGDFGDLLARSGLDERRPADDADRIAAMAANATLTVTAWDGDTLVGVSRCVTDFAYCCYCSDLAVDRAYQGKGVGRRLLVETKAAVHPAARCFLISAPGKVDYYRHIGLDPVDRVFDFTGLQP